MNEIRTRAEVAGELPNSLPEPMLTLSQLQGLLRDAAALERAQRPIVLHTAPAAATTVTAAPTAVGFAPPQHPGIDITIPAAPTAAWALLRHRAPQRPGWGVRLACASMTATLAAAAAAGATDGNAGAVAAAAAGVLGTVAGIAQAVNEHTRSEV